MESENGGGTAKDSLGCQGRSGTKSRFIRPCCTSGLSVSFFGGLSEPLPRCTLVPPHADSHCTLRTRVE